MGGLNAFPDGLTHICSNRHFLEFQGVRTLAMVVWGTYLVMNHQVSMGICLFFLPGNSKLGLKNVPHCVRLEKGRRGGGSKAICAIPKYMADFFKGASLIKGLNELPWIVLHLQWQSRSRHRVL